MSTSIETLTVRLQQTYDGIKPLINFLETVRGPENTFSGKFSVKLSTVNRLFNDSWEDIPTGSGHKKFKHTVTGNVDEPAWHLAHEEKINFFALGHAATEKVGPKAIMNHLKKTFNLDVLFIEENNPF